MKAPTDLDIDTYFAKVYSLENIFDIAHTSNIRQTQFTAIKIKDILRINLQWYFQMKKPFIFSSVDRALL